jgi:hypothetical protein
VPKPTDTVAETPDRVPSRERLPWADETLEPVPDIMRTDATAPLAVDTDADTADIMSGGLPTITRSAEPWLAVALDPARAILCATEPDATETVLDEADTGPPASQPLAWLIVKAEPATTPASTIEPAAVLTEVAFPDTTPVILMEPVAPLTEAELPASTPIRLSAPVAADAPDDVPARTARVETAPLAADCARAVPLTS